MRHQTLSLFYQFFKEHKADVVRYNMLRGVCEAAGLGSPPIFTTSISESLNKVIKQHVHYKPSQWPEFNENMRNLVESKREEVIRALSGRGLFRLRPQYAHLGVDVVTWQWKWPDQRKKLVQPLDECSLLPDNSKTQQKSSNEQATSPSDPSSTACHISISIQSPSKQQSVGIASPSQSRCSRHPFHLSISSSESGITSLHQCMLQAMGED